MGKRPLSVAALMFAAFEHLMLGACSALRLP